MIISKPSGSQVEVKSFYQGRLRLADQNNSHRKVLWRTLLALYPGSWKEYLWSLACQILNIQDLDIQDLDCQRVKIQDLDCPVLAYKNEYSRFRHAIVGFFSTDFFWCLFFQVVGMLLPAPSLRTVIFWQVCLFWHPQYTLMDSLYVWRYLQ